LSNLLNYVNSKFLAIRLLQAGIFSYKHKEMTLKQIFIQNLKEFRKKEGFSQMKLAEFCHTAPSYIGQIETGVRFPSLELIEKIAAILKIEPYHFFIDRTAKNTENTYPKLPRSMQNEIRSELNFSINELIRETFEKY